MKLSYKILWVENEADWVDAFPMDRIEEHISKEGFHFEFDVRSSPDEVHQTVKRHEYDLLVVDYNITEGEFNGSDLIRKIRDNKCLTEVIFYSSAGLERLHSEAAAHQLEGVFFSTRREDQLVRKITDVFDLTVEKVLDLNNMRGIVMAGVADLDGFMEEIIRTRHSRCTADEQAKLCRKIVGKIRPKAKDILALAAGFPDGKAAALELLLAELEAGVPAAFEELIHPRRLDSSKRVDLVAGFCGAIETLGEHKEQIQAVRRLLKWRNALAHQRPAPDANGLLEFEIDPGVKEAFDDEKTRQLRQEIRAYTLTFEGVLGKVKEA